MSQHHLNPKASTEAHARSSKLFRLRLSQVVLVALFGLALTSCRVSSITAPTDPRHYSSPHGAQRPASPGGDLIAREKGELR